MSFDGFKALNELSLYLDKGEMRAIIGPNGAGKTTTMRILTTLLTPTSGEAPATDVVVAYAFGWEFPNRWRLDSSKTAGR